MNNDSVTQEDIREDQAAKQIIDSAIAVHREMGPGLLESVYEICLTYELEKRNVKFVRQKPFPIIYDGHKLDCDLRLDLLVDDRVIVELKTAEKIIPLHEAQIMSYMKISQKRLGLILNFNAPLMKQGIKRFVMRNSHGGHGARGGLAVIKKDDA